MIGRSVLMVLFCVAAARGGVPPQFFSTTLYPMLEKSGCRGCHSTEGVASPTRLHFPEPDATPAQIERFGKSLVVLVDSKQPARSLLRAKPTTRIAHTGGKRIIPDSA